MSQVCIVEGCDKPRIKKKRLCGMHRARLQRHGSLELPPRPRSTCSIKDCTKPHDSRELCSMHLTRLKRTGTTDPPPRAHGPVQVRFWAKVTKTQTCWLWVGFTAQHGYGTIGIGVGKQMLVHRYVYELLVGPIPAGLTIDHLCRVRNCVNPAHLEPVTQAENSRRAAVARWAAA